MRLFLRLPAREHPHKLEIAEPQGLSQTPGASDRQETVRTLLSETNCKHFRQLLSVSGQKGYYILCCVSVERRWRKLYFKRLLPLNCFLLWSAYVSL